MLSYTSKALFTIAYRLTQFLTNNSKTVKTTIINHILKRLIIIEM